MNQEELRDFAARFAEAGPGGTGRRVRFNGWEAWTFSVDGLIASSIGTFDAAEYERQLAEGV